MKKKDFTELKSKTLKDLRKLVSERKLEATKKKMEIGAGKEKNLKSFKNLRQEIARIYTIVREKEIVEKLQPKEEVKKK